MKGYVVVENGPCFAGEWRGGEARAGELVFNTSHNGYEEIATDPSYYGQIMIMCAPQQGNYGVDDGFWESDNIWIQGFSCLDLYTGDEVGKSWQQRLLDHKIPIVTDFDTRTLVLHLRDQGTSLGALVPAESEEEARQKASALVDEFKKREKDWVYQVSCKEAKVEKGQKPDGPRVALIDYGCKTNIKRELLQRCSEIKVFPSRTSATDIMAYQPDGIMLSNGPGDPELVEQAVPVIKELLGQKTIFGICMGHQLLAKALGAKTFRLKFGHRGANHPIKNTVNSEIFMTSQNHGYAIDPDSVTGDVRVTHINLNDQTVAGIDCIEKKCFSVQFHPESHPGPREAEVLFDQFVEWIRNDNR